MRRCLLALAVLLHAAPALAQLQKVETGDLRLVYISPSETFLVPHAGRTFMSSVTFLKTLFDYTAAGKDHGAPDRLLGRGQRRRDERAARHAARADRAAQLHVRNDRGERAHEHDHEPRAGARDRDGSGGGPRSVLPRALRRQGVADRRAAGIDAVLLPDDRRASRRRAGFTKAARCSSTPGWPAASAARRAATTRWCFARWSRTTRRFYDPLGLASEGTKIDFQTEVNSYLYGTRFMTWLGYHYTPAQVIQWLGREARAARRTTRASSSSCSARRSRRRGRNGSRSSTTFQQANLDAIRKYPITPYKDLSPRALGSVSRALLRPGVTHDLRGLQLPGRRRARRLDLDGRPARRRI